VRYVAVTSWSLTRILQIDGKKLNTVSRNALIGQPNRQKAGN